jgi:hypothetical protein
MYKFSPPEIDCNQTAMGLPPVMSAVFLIGVILVKRGRLGGISETPLLPFRGSSVIGMCVCKIFITHNTGGIAEPSHG